MKVQISFRQPGDTKYYRYTRENDAYNLLDVVKDVFQSTSVYRLEVLIETVPDDPARNSTTSFTLEKKPVSTPGPAMSMVPPAVHTAADGGGKTATTPEKKPRLKATTQGTKPCSHCKQILPFDAFTKKKTGPHGLNPWCKDCIKKKNASEQSKEYQRNYQRTHYHKKQRDDPTPFFHSSEPTQPSSPKQDNEGDVSGLEPGRTAPTTTPPVTLKPPKPTPVFTTKQDTVIKEHFDELGPSGIYLKNLLPQHYSLTDIKQRCMELKLMDAFGNKYHKPEHRNRKDEQPPQVEENEDV